MGVGAGKRDIVGVFPRTSPEKNRKGKHDCKTPLEKLCSDCISSSANGSNFQKTKANIS